MENAQTTTGLETLLQSHGGLLNLSPAPCPCGDEPSIVVRLTRAGDISVLSTAGEKRGCSFAVKGMGAGLEEKEAIVPALAEGLERYCASTFRSDQFILATANELGKEAMDLDSVPRCSAWELSHPKCPLLPTDKTKPIRWVRGLSLLDGAMMYVPAVMVYANAGYAGRAERFWLSISTGCAAHMSYERALLRGVYEVMERDAIAITWLQKLSLPRIEVDYLPPALAPYWSREHGQSRPNPGRYEHSSPASRSAAASR